MNTLCEGDRRPNVALFHSSKLRPNRIFHVSYILWRNHIDHVCRSHNWWNEQQKYVNRPAAEELYGKNASKVSTESLAKTTYARSSSLFITYYAICNLSMIHHFYNLVVRFDRSLFYSQFVCNRKCDPFECRRNYAFSTLSKSVANVQNIKYNIQLF